MMTAPIFVRNNVCIPILADRTVTTVAVLVLILVLVTRGVEPWAAIAIAAAAGRAAADCLRQPVSSSKKRHRVS